MIEPRERVLMLRDLHLPALTAMQSRVLAARVCGFKPKAIGQRLFRNERDVRRVLERLEDLVCVPAGAERDLALLVLWFTYHAGCEHRCAAAAAAMIDTHAVFPPEITAEIT